jgi:hypothetical protein
MANEAEMQAGLEKPRAENTALAHRRRSPFPPRPPLLLDLLGELLELRFPALGLVGTFTWCSAAGPGSRCPSCSTGKISQDQQTPKT